MPGADAFLHAVLGAAAAEAGRLASAGTTAQDGVHILLHEGRAGAELQTLDALVQQARGLERFLSVLAAACPGDWRVDTQAAASGLLLDAQRRRLAPSACRDDPTAPPGAFELF